MEKKKEREQSGFLSVHGWKAGKEAKGGEGAIEAADRMSGHVRGEGKSGGGEPLVVTSITGGVGVGGVLQHTSQGTAGDLGAGRL